MERRGNLGKAGVIRVNGDERSTCRSLAAALDNLACRMSFRQLLRSDKEACAVAQKRNEVLQLAKRKKRIKNKAIKKVSFFGIFFFGAN